MKSEGRIMGGLADFVIKRHKIILIVGLVLSVLAFIGAGNIEVKTEIKDMMPEDNPVVQSYEEVEDLFYGGTSVMITVEGTDTLAMIRAAEDFVALVRADPEVMQYVRAIDLKVDREFATDWGLMLQKASDLEKMDESYRRLNLLPFVTALNDSFEETYTGDEAEEEIDNNRKEREAVSMLKQLGGFAEKLTQILESPDPQDGAGLAETFFYGQAYAFNHDDTMLTFTFLPSLSAVDFEEIVDMMTGIKAINVEVQAAYPELHISYTGDVPMQADEQDALGFTMVVPALVAMVVILLLFIFSFDRFRSIVFVLLSLVVGIVFNYGFVGVTIREINMMTSIMAVLLVGLGVDYGIQVVTNFSNYRREGCTPAEALRNTYVKAGMGVFLAALTTSVAFFVMAATGSKAFSQFGVMMGSGIVMCFIAMFFILPAMLLWWGKKEPGRQRFPRFAYRFLAKLGVATHKHSTLTIVLGTVATAGLLVAALTLNSMETDLFNLEPQAMPSVVQYKKVMEKYDITPFPSMIVLDSVEEARGIADQLEKEYMVADVNSISYYIPDPAEQTTRLVEIRRMRAVPSRHVEWTYTPEQVELLADEIQRLEWNAIEVGDLSVAGLGEDNKILATRNRMIREIFGAEVGRPGQEVFQKLITALLDDPEAAAAKLTTIDASFAPEMDRLFRAMTAADRPMTLADLPEEIIEGLLDDTGTRNLLVIYPRGGVFDDMATIERFNETLAEVSPRITGTTQITTEWEREVTSSSKRAAFYIFGAVFVFLLISFRNLRDTLVASVPLVLGMIWMLGIYPLLGLKLNLVNIAVIPLVIGMGIDFGIHLAHRYRTERNIETTYRYTGKGVFLSAATTMIGFGSLALIASFPSIQMIGAILFVGIGACLATSMIILPALLGIGNGRPKAVSSNMQEIGEYR